MIGSSTVLTDFTIQDYPLSPYYKVPLTTYASWLHGLNVAAMHFTDTNLQLITDRLARPAVFPLFLLLLFVLALTVLKTVWKLLPTSWVVLLFMKLFCKSKKEKNAEKIIEGGEPIEKSNKSNNSNNSNPSAKAAGSNPGSRKVSGLPGTTGPTPSTREPGDEVYPPSSDPLSNAPALDGGDGGDLEARLTQVKYPSLPPTSPSPYPRPHPPSLPPGPSPRLTHSQISLIVTALSQPIVL